MTLWLSIALRTLLEIFYLLPFHANKKTPKYYIKFPQTRPKTPKRIINLISVLYFNKFLHQLCSVVSWAPEIKWIKDKKISTR